MDAGRPFKKPLPPPGWEIIEVNPENWGDCWEEILGFSKYLGMRLKRHGDWWDIGSEEEADLRMIPFWVKSLIKFGQRGFIFSAWSLRCSKDC